MRTRFNEQLKMLNDNLIEMGRQCQDCITYAAQAMITENYQMADMAIQLEKDIDENERDIQNLCTKMLLRQQPVARDLKAIQAALKMIVDLERIGAQGSNIAQILLKPKQNEVLRCDIAEIIMRDKGKKFTLIKPIAKMSDLVIKMLNIAIESFVQRDAEKSQIAINIDGEVDSLFYKIKDDLIEMIACDKKSGGEALETLMIAKYLERIGDHTVNISESVIGML